MEPDEFLEDEKSRLLVLDISGKDKVYTTGDSIYGNVSFYIPEQQESISRVVVQLDCAERFMGWTVTHLRQLTRIFTSTQCSSDNAELAGWYARPFKFELDERSIRSPPTTLTDSINIDVTWSIIARLELDVGGGYTEVQRQDYSEVIVHPHFHNPEPWNSSVYDLPRPPQRRSELLRVTLVEAPQSLPQKLDSFDVHFNIQTHKKLFICCVRLFLEQRMHELTNSPHCFSTRRELLGHSVQLTQTEAGTCLPVTFYRCHLSKVTPPAFRTHYLDVSYDLVVSIEGMENDEAYFPVDIAFTSSSNAEY